MVKASEPLERPNQCAEWPRCTHDTSEQRLLWDMYSLVSHSVLSWLGSARVLVIDLIRSSCLLVC